MHKKDNIYDTLKSNRVLQCRNMDLRLMDVASLRNVPQKQSCSSKNVLLYKLHVSVAGMTMKIKPFWLLLHFCINGVLRGHGRFIAAQM